MEQTVTNPTRSRKFGFGYNTSPTQGDHGYRFEPPTGPDYTGTIDQVHTAIADDRTLAAVQSGGTLFRTAWFYAGKRILGINGSTDPRSFGDWLRELNFEQEYRRMNGVTVASVAAEITLTLQD